TERDRDFFSCFCYANRLILLDVLSRPQPIQDLSFLLPKFGRDENSNRLSDRLSLRISEDTLGRCVPTGNNRIQILGDNRISGRFDNSRQPESGRFRHSALADITDRTCNKDTIRRLNRTQTYLYRELLSIFTQCEQLEASSHRANSRLGEESDSVCLMSFTESTRD